MRIAAAFAAAVLAIGAVTAASLRSLSARRDWSRWVVHTQEVQLAIARVLALATEAETRQRGYLLTGHEEFSVTGVDDANADEVTVRADGKEFRARVRLDTPREREYLRHGGILQFVLRRLLAG